MKSILIIGMGHFGVHLAYKMAELGNDVMIVDKDEELVEQLAEDFTDSYVGDCTHENVVEALDVENFDICFVTVGENFESSLVITALLKKLGANYVVAKSNQTIQAEILKTIGANEVVYPDRELAERLAVRYNSKNIFDCIPLTDEVSIYEIAVPSNWIGKTIGDVNIRNRYNVNVIGVKREDMVVVSIMPCLAKKSEAAREEFKVNGNPDVDFSLTTRELAHMIKQCNLNLNDMPSEDFDSPLGESTGAAVIFGATGGVMEAAVRTAYEVFTKKKLDNIDFEVLRGFDGVKTATVDFAGTPINVAVAYGLNNARIIMEEVRDGNPRGFHAVEVMACPGGCIGGAGQPYHHGDSSIIRKRMEATYREDAGKPIRKSHENPSIIAIYKEYFGEPCGHKSHELLHTHYFDRSKKIEKE